MGFDAVKRRADLETYMADVTSKEKGATFSRNPLFYLVGWRPCNWWGRWLSLLGILIFCAKGMAQKEWR